MDPPMTDLVALYLGATGERPEDDAVSEAVTIAGITEGLEFGEGRLAGRVKLLSALEELQATGILEHRECQVRGVDGKRSTYFLTERGRARVRAMRSQYEDEEIDVRDGVDTTIELRDVDEYLADPALPRALSRVTEDGVLYIESEGREFVNRDRELSTFESVLEAGRESTTQGVLVAGEAGIGKTTLVSDEVAERARTAGFSVHVAGCRAEANEPYAPFRVLLEELGNDEHPLADDGGGHDATSADEFDADREAMFDAVANALERAAADTPMFVVVEDMHLAGEPTVALAAHLVEAIDAQIVFAGTYRPEDLDDDHPVHELIGICKRDEPDSITHHVELDRLTERQTRQLIEGIVERPTVPDEFASVIYRRTGGNPLFVEESVTKLLDAGEIDPQNDVFPTDPDVLPMPTSVAEAVDLRLEVLDDATDRVLDVAAVIGQTVPWDVLTETLDLSAATVGTHVELLVDARFLERTEVGNLRFVSGLVRESCVERLDESERRRLHAEIADAYDVQRADDPDHYAAVAHHRAAAGDDEAAFEAYVEAGDRAIDVYAAKTAADTYQAAVKIATEDLDRFDDDVLEAIEQLAYARQLLDDYEAADRHLEYVANRTEDADRRRSVARSRALMWRERGDYETALRVVEDALEDVGVAESEESAELLSVKGFVHGKREEYDAAMDAFDRGVEVAHAVGDEELVTSLKRSKTSMNLDRGTVDEEVLSVQEEKVAEAREEDDDRGVAIELLNLGLAALEYGDLERAESVTRESIEMFEAQGTEMTVCDAQNTLGVIQQVGCKWEAARETFETALETATDVDNERIVTYAHTNLAELSYSRGDLADVEWHVERGLETANDLDNPHYHAGLLTIRARAAVARDEPERAIEVARRALEMARAVEIDSLHVESLDALGRGALAAGDLEQAEDTYRSAIDLLPVDSDERNEEEASIRTGLAWSLLEGGDPAGALTEASNARDASASLTEDREGIRARIVAAASRRALEDFDAAEDVIVEALELASAQGRRRLEWLASLERARLAADRGDVDLAVETTRSVARESRDGGATRLAREAQRELEAFENDT